MVPGSALDARTVGGEADAERSEARVKLSGGVGGACTGYADTLVDFLGTVGICPGVPYEVSYGGSGGGATAGTGPVPFHGQELLSSDTGEAYSELHGGALVVVVNLGLPLG